MFYKGSGASPSSVHNYIAFGVIFLFLWKCSLALIFLSADCKFIISSKLLTQVTNLVISSKQTRYSSQIASWWHRHLAFPASIYPTCGRDGWIRRHFFKELGWGYQLSYFKKAIKGNCWANAGQSLRIVWVGWVWEGEHMAEGPQEQRVSLQPPQSVWEHQQALNATTRTSPLKQQEKKCGLESCCRRPEENQGTKLLWSKGHANLWGWNKLLKLHSGLGQCCAMKQCQYDLFITVNRGCWGQ